MEGVGSWGREGRKGVRVGRGGAGHLLLFAVRYPGWGGDDFCYVLSAERRGIIHGFGS